MFKTADEILREKELGGIFDHEKRIIELQDIRDFVLLPRLEEAEDRLREELLFRKGVMI